MLQYFNSSSAFKTLWKWVRLFCRPIQPTKNIWRYAFGDVTPPFTPWGRKTSQMETQLKINMPSAFISEKLIHSCYSKSRLFSCCFWKGKKATSFCGRKNLWCQSHVCLVATSMKAADWKVSEMVQQGIRKPTGSRVCPSVALLISATHTEFLFYFSTEGLW